MSQKTVHSQNTPGKTYTYVDNGEPMRGGMKDVYFSPDKSYVVAFYRETPDEAAQERIRKITTTYFDSFFNREGGAYYKKLYCWPTDVIKEEDKWGIIVPVYPPAFFFKKGYAANDLIQGKEKEGKWFAAAKFRNPHFPLRLDNSELGNWQSYFQIGVNIARGVKRLHSAGLAHSDLSYKNVLIDPVTKAAALIDIDGLVVPGLFPPDVIGTADFIAPEVLSTKHLNLLDEKRNLPNRLTDLHALAVMIYMYLLYRHPLKGGKVHDLDTEKDDLLSMGEKALFIEHPTDTSNQPKRSQIPAQELPWADTDKLPYTITGPYLKTLFDRAFIDGLHNPQKRPTATEWEEALLKTTDLMQPCANPACRQKWYVFDNSSKPRCPFCGTPHAGSLPMLDLYFQYGEGVWRPENHRLMVYHDQYLFGWHVNRNLHRNEHLTEAEKKPVGYFSFQRGRWLLVNQTLTSLRDLSEDKDIPIGSAVELTAGKKLLLSREEGGLVAVITLANAPV